MNSQLRGVMFALGLAVAVPSAWADAYSQQFNVELARQPVRSALNELSKQTNLQVLLQSSLDVDQLEVGPLSGRYTIESALSEVLSRTGLSFQRINERTIAITSALPKSGQVVDPKRNRPAARMFLQMADRKFSNAEPRRYRSISRPLAPWASWLLATGPK